MKRRILAAIVAAMCFGSVVPVNAIAETAAQSLQTGETEKNTMATDINSTIKDIGVFEKSEKMTLDDVIELSKKGDELTWSDFEAYNGIKSGTPFDMLAYLYLIDEGYYLSVSGAVDGAPDKVQLCHYNQNISVDVLTGDVEAFIAEYSNYELPDIGYTFDEIYNMTEDEVRTVFNEKGLTDTEKYHVYPQRNGNTAVNNNSMTVLLYPENYMINLTGHELVSHVIDMNDKDKLFKNSDIVWDSDKVKKSLGLPKEYFDVYDVSSMTVTKSAPEGEDPDIRKYCECSIRCKSEDKDKIADLRRAALNYIQLNPDFALVYPETYGGENVSTPVKSLKGDANCDGQVDLSDAVMIMQALANPDKYGIGGTAEYHLTEQGKLNGDMNGDGLTVGDAQAIQKMLLGLE
ncbi:MAG: dockerin type I repeat-containing protein [Ruminococcus sp.]|uniref:dockerin type I repeat-containing protein n=1 Tax=Ruminococcus sp. TaxID=41978 RepID=UPI002A206051|nr:dockerin type I repeat-containing protein [Ruminococcus sp.]